VTTHLTRDELQRWWTHGAPAERERVVAHLAECDECGALYAEVMDAQPVAPLTEPADVRLVARAYRVFGPRGRVFARQRWPRGWLWPRALIAAAAALLLAIAIPWSQVLSPGRSDENEIRGSTLQPLSPIGAVQQPVRFTWVSPVRAARYDVEVRGIDGRLIVRFSTPSERFGLAADDQARLEPGRSYTWQVVAVDAAGDVVMRATPQEFVVSSSRR